MRETWPGATGLKCQRGQALAEITIATSLLLFMLLGLIDFAPALTRAAQLSQAVREGVDYGHTAPSDTAGIRSRAKGAAPELNLSDADITVTCYHTTTSTVRVCASAALGDTVKVEASYVHVPITTFFTGVIGSSLTIQRSATSLIY